MFEYPFYIVCISPSSIENTVPTRGRRNFVQSVLHENIDLIFAPIITIIPQLFFLPYFILQSVMGCHSLESAFVRYLYIGSAFIYHLPQMTSFLLYVRFSSIYYEHFRETTVGKKIVFLCNCCHRKTMQSSKSPRPFQYTFSKTTNEPTI